jgi:2-oxoglutarate dehydrogenase complex dehydrogenase (E1) component-like enzyme
MTAIESGLNPANLAFVEDLYENFLRDASSVSPEWREYFSRVANGELRFPQPRFGPSFKPHSLFNPPGSAAVSAAAGGTPSLSGLVEVPAGIQDRL